MVDRASLRMTQDEFLDWAQHEDGRYELVDGVPVPRGAAGGDGSRAMAGAAERHDQIVFNLIAALRPQLRNTGCRGFSADYAVRIPTGNIRRPDVGINCAPREDRSLAAGSPRAVIEVLSPSTRSFDRFVKLEEYKSVESIQHIVLIDPDLPQVFHWMRAAVAEWQSVLLDGLDRSLTFDDISVRLSLREIYEELDFRPRPRLVDGTTV